MSEKNNHDSLGLPSEARDFIVNNQSVQRFLEVARGISTYPTNLMGSISETSQNIAKTAVARGFELTSTVADTSRQSMINLGRTVLSRVFSTDEPSLGDRPKNKE